LWPPEAPSKLIGDMVLFISCVTLLTLLGGLVPKALVLSRTEKAALNLSPLLELIMRGIAPILFLLEKISSSLF